MGQVSRYCKAYAQSTLQQFSHWLERPGTLPTPDSNTSPDTTGADKPRAIYYLHENYFVTRGIYADEDIVFDAVTPEWIRFCADVLAFRVPDDLVCDNRTKVMDAQASSQPGNVGQE